VLEVDCEKQLDLRGYNPPYSMLFVLEVLFLSTEMPPFTG
jgi:hypothetical protein